MLDSCINRNILVCSNPKNKFDSPDSERYTDSRGKNNNSVTIFWKATKQLFCVVSLLFKIFLKMDSRNISLVSIILVGDVVAQWLVRHEERLLTVSHG